MAANIPANETRAARQATEFEHLVGTLMEAPAGSQIRQFLDHQGVMSVNDIQFFSENELATLMYPKTDQDGHVTNANARLTRAEKITLKVAIILGNVSR